MITVGEFLAQNKKIDLLYEFANHIKNADNLPPLMYGVRGADLLVKLRDLDSVVYDKRVMKFDQKLGKMDT